MPMRQTAALGLLENIQRTDLNPFEQAQGLRDILVLWDCTRPRPPSGWAWRSPHWPTSCACCSSRGPAQFVLDNNLTERHARAVLRLPENRRSEALINIAKRRLNARQTDRYIEQLLNSTAKGRHRISMVRDVRIFVNTIDHAIRLMTDNGVPATAHREEKDGYIEYTVAHPHGGSGEVTVPCGTEKTCKKSAKYALERELFALYKTENKRKIRTKTPESGSKSQGSVLYY